MQADTRAASLALTPDADDGVMAAAAANGGNPNGRGRRGRGARGKGRGRCRRGDPACGAAHAQEDDAEAVPEPVPAHPASSPTLRSHLGILRPLQLSELLSQRVYTFQTPPRQLRGLLRTAFRTALETLRDAATIEDECDGWKLFMLAPRMLLIRAPGQSRVKAVSVLAAAESSPRWARAEARSERRRRSTSSASAPFATLPSDGRAASLGAGVAAAAPWRSSSGQCPARNACSRRRSSSTGMRQGTAHEVRQGEGGEQGDPLMPALSALGQHAALTAVQARVRSTDQLFACLDDVYVTGPPEHTANQFHSCLATLLAGGGDTGTMPELSARRAQLPLRLASWSSVELGGCFSQSTLTFLRLLARARARQRAPWCAAAARQAMVHRWTTLAALAALRAHACTQLEIPVGEPVDPLDGQELALGELLAGAPPPQPSRPGHGPLPPWTHCS